MAKVSQLFKGDPATLQQKSSSEVAQIKNQEHLNCFGLKCQTLQSQTQEESVCVFNESANIIEAR